MIVSFVNSIYYGRFVNGADYWSIVIGLHKKTAGTALRLPTVYFNASRTQAQGLQQRPKRMLFAL